MHAKQIQIHNTHGRRMERVLEKAGMKLVDTEKDGLVVGDRVYEKLIYEYKASLNG